MTHERRSASWLERLEGLKPGPERELHPKTIELIRLVLSVSSAPQNPEAIRLHIRGSLHAGATKEELVEVLHCASVPALHSCTVAAPVLLEEARRAGAWPGAGIKSVPTPFCDKMRADEIWDHHWDALYELDPEWTEHYMIHAHGLFSGRVLDPQLAELLFLALNASATQLFEPGMRRHVRTALHLGVSVEEIMAVLKLCAAHGVEAARLASPILDEEFAAHRGKKRRAS